MHGFHHRLGAVLAALLAAGLAVAVVTGCTTSEAVQPRAETGEPAPTTAPAKPATIALHTGNPRESGGVVAAGSSGVRGVHGHGAAAPTALLGRAL